jgi:hypothetical protein
LINILNDDFYQSTTATDLQAPLIIANLNSLFHHKQRTKYRIKVYFNLQSTFLDAAARSERFTCYPAASGETNSVPRTIIPESEEIDRNNLA